VPRRVPVTPGNYLPMQSTRRRLIVVAVVVCGFAVGMAGLLNFFKYRAAADRILTDRLVVTGRMVENSIQSSLALGLQFAEIGTLPGMLDRERATDDLIVGIDIFDTDGRMLYSTDRLRASRPVPPAWLAAAKAAGNADWRAEDGHEAAAGITVKNNFDLTIGYLALRYSIDRVREASNSVAAELAMTALAIFIGAATFSSLALIGVMHRLGRNLQAVEVGLGQGEAARATARALKGPFGPALRRFIETTRRAEAQIADLRAELETRESRMGPQTVLLGAQGSLPERKRESRKVHQ
jgi:hypothetical protein